MNYTIYTLTATVCDNVSDWDFESYLLTDNSQWAVNTSFANTKIIARAFTGMPSNSGGHDWIAVGIKAIAKTGSTNESGVPYIETDSGEQRLRLNLTKDGSNFSTTNYVIDSSSSGTREAGNYDDLWGYSSITLAEIENDSFGVAFHVPTDLIDESSVDWHRSIQYIQLEVAFVDKSIALELTSSDGECSGNVALEFEG